MTHSKESCYKRLVETRRRLEHSTSDEHDTRNRNGFLSAVQDAIQALNVDLASRQYRHNFSLNYRVLFLEKGIHYRSDIFDASIELHPVIWVNGDKFEICINTLASAELLQVAFANLKQALNVDIAVAHSPSPHQLEELRLVLVQFDAAFACFERDYVSELIAIEAKARHHIIRAVEQERLLSAAETRMGDVVVIRDEQSSERCSAEVNECRQRLVSCIANLNSVANSRGKGRDDLDEKILMDAKEYLWKCRKGDSSVRSAAASLGILARDVVESFEAIRRYLRNAGTCLESVDPHLCNNAGLVERLVDWEESWEVGAKYVRNEALREALVDVIEELRKVDQAVPVLKSMCEECDVGFFLCIPRLIVLRYLQSPQGCREFLRSLLPHHFRVVPAHDNSFSNGNDADELVSQELSEFKARFWRIQQVLNESVTPAEELLVEKHGRDSCDIVWELITHRAVVGSNGLTRLYARFVPEVHRKVAMEAVETFMVELERWSLELQRHSADDWNRCSSLLARCFLSSTTEKIAKEFHV